MSTEQIADEADMIVAGYAYKMRDGYIEEIGRASCRERV